MTEKYYKMNDGCYRFFMAQFGSWANDAQIVFRVRVDRDPKERAKEKGIKNYDRIIQVTDTTIINQWLSTHPNHKIIN